MSSIEEREKALLDTLRNISGISDFEVNYLMLTAKRESGYNPNAKNPDSSAKGLYQFIDQTWLEVFKQHGAAYEHAELAKLIKRGPDGEYYVEDSEKMLQIMDLKRDPAFSSRMAVEFTRANAEALRPYMDGHDPGMGELYLAHFLGSAGAIDVLRADPNTPISSGILRESVMNSNESIRFKGKDFRSFTARDLIDWAAWKMQAEAYVRNYENGVATDSRVPPEEVLRGAGASEDNINMLRNVEGGLLGAIVFGIIQALLEHARPPSEGRWREADGAVPEVNLGALGALAPSAAYHAGGRVLAGIGRD